MDKLRLGIIGCGAVTEIFHLPAIKDSERAEVTVLVDKSLARAQELVDQYSIPAVETDYQNILGKVDCALIALPNSLHGPVAVDLLKQGIHVLVEKPMASQSADCDRMIEASKKSGAVVGIAMVRRFYQAVGFVKQALDAGLLGRLLSIDFREGAPFAWPVKSDFILRKDISGGGVLMDVGVHALDQLLWWFGDYDVAEYRDDAFGGIEADCELRIKLKNGAEGIVELSRTRTLRNSCVIRGECGEIEVGIGYDSGVRLCAAGGAAELKGQALEDDWPDEGIKDAFSRQHDDFFAAVANRSTPRAPGAEGKRIVEIVQRCYATRKPLEYPWLSAGATQERNIKTA